MTGSARPPLAAARRALAALLLMAAAPAAATSYLAISPGSLYVRDSDDQAFTFVEERGAVERSVGYLDNPCYYAAVRLPQGATVTGFVLYAIDNDAGGNFTAALHRKALGSLGLAETMASLTSSSASAGVRVFTDLTIADPVIENYIFYYYAEICLPSGVSELHGVYLSYTP